MITTEIKRSILSKLFIYSVLFGLLLQILGIVIMNKDILDEIIRNGFVSKELLADRVDRDLFRHFSTKLYYIVVPVLCCIPYTSSLAKEYNNNFLFFIKIRTKYKDYVYAKIISCFISGFLVIFTSMALFYLITLPFDGIFRGNPNTFLGSIAVKSLDLYMWIYIIISSLLGGVYSLMGLAISFFTKNTLIITTGPLIYYIMGMFIFSFLKLYNLRPDVVNLYTSYNNIGWVDIWGQLLVLCLISLYLIFISIKREKKYA